MYQPFYGKYSYVVSTVIGTLSKPIIFVKGIQVKPETLKTWISLCLSVRSYSKLFYKFITYYMFNNSYNIDTWNVRNQVVEYIMPLKRRRRIKLKANSHEEDKYYLMFNNILTSGSNILQSNTHKGCCVLTATEYNYKLKSVIGRENKYRA